MEKELWEKYLNGRSDADRDALYEFYAAMQIVERIATKVFQRIPPSALLQHDDLVSYGSEALLWAISRFDPSRDVKFTSYAGTRIRGAMIDGIRSADWAPRKARDTEKIVTEMVSIESLTGDDMDTGGLMSTGIDLDSVESADEFRKAMRFLTSRQRRVFRLLYVDQWTLKDVGRSIGCSPTAVAKIRQEILDRLARATGRELLPACPQC